MMRPFDPARAPGARSAGADDGWVFAYGSLMWEPGFPHVGAAPALVRGYHRAFCVYSVHYRGTPARPGLVLGLDRGGACRGRAYRIAAADLDDVLGYLDARELVTDVYLRRVVPVEVAGRRVPAVAYVADRAHPQYAAKLSLERAAAIIARSAGSAGANRDYLIHTVAHLDALGIDDGPLHALLRLVEPARARDRI